jgi:hypothetical protein
VFCITADVHNNRAIAEEVCAGRFTHAGTTLDLGTEPDWLGADLPADEEWRIEWTKFYYGLDLANAYRDRREPRYLRTWQRLVGSWLRQVDVGLDESDVAARRMQNWTYAWSMFAGTPAFPGLEEGLDSEILTGLASHAASVLDKLTPGVARNHRTLELYALFIVALAFPQIDPRSDLLDFTISELHRTLEEGFWPDGVHREGSTHYHLVALRSLLGARENARRFALDLPDGFDVHLERACEFALHCHRPDGLVPALSDADSASYPEVLELGAALLGRPDLRYAATAGNHGTQPRRRYASFPEGGYFVQRSGWGAGESAFCDERWLIFDCGPLGEGGHGHYDLLSAEMFAYGRPLLVDPGRYTYSEEGVNLRRWFKGTSAHNTVVVDGLDQTPYRRGQPGKQVAAESFEGRSSVAGFDVLQGRALSPCYDASHTRRIFFVADEYWIVDDELESAHPHRYDLRWHLAPEAWDRTYLTPTDGGTLVRGPGVALFIAGDAEVRLERGWVSPRYGVKHAAPVINARARGKKARFVTLVFPLRHSRSAPLVRVRSSEVPEWGPLIVEVEGAGREEGTRDIVAWAGRQARLRLGALECRATGACLRESATRQPLFFAGFDVTVVKVRDGGELQGIHPGPRVRWAASEPVVATEPVA